METVKRPIRGHSLYTVWDNMKRRCGNKNHPQFDYYGNRGISVCDEWYNSSISFINWALNNGWEKGLCFDRIDNDKGYYPDNCRFVTYQQSILNRRLVQRNNKSGYRGVWYNKETKKWLARTIVNKRYKHLGCFTSPRLAAIRYDVEAIILNDGRPTNFNLTKEGK